MVSAHPTDTCTVSTKKKGIFFFLVIPGVRQEQQGTFQTILFSSKLGHQRNASLQGKVGVWFPAASFGVSPLL